MLPSNCGRILMSRGTHKPLVVQLDGRWKVSVVLSFLVEIAIGIVAGIIVGLLFLWYEFTFSTAVSRVRKAAEATREIRKAKHDSRGPLRNRYRYSLGVIIDRLDRKDESGNDKWPPLVHFYDKDKEKPPQLANRDGEPNLKADRWDFFELYIRPVAEDIRRFSYVSKYPLAGRLCKETRQLGALVKLCNQLENVVCELDGAFEDKLVTLDRVEHRVMDKVDHIVIVRPTESAIDRVSDLRKSYEDLDTTWRAWLCAIGEAESDDSIIATERSEPGDS
jgi:hypothetical protein